jgi:hypothetical protein
MDRSQGYRRKHIPGAKPDNVKETKPESGVNIGERNRLDERSHTNGKKYSERAKPDLLR